ncbi:head-tail adaptor protein [Salinicoccus roseus]|uniref:head-tail adaptor protein n=1 Tax=Salinicoccus roseus TaxID=45670 RepID=UPI0023016F70|nr:head-tail adaptor protein [Salinicoccus roseus]
MRRFSKLKSRVTFFKPGGGGFMPGEESNVEYYTCYAHVDNVWLKDIEIAKTNNTLNDVTVTIRDTQGQYIIENNMTFKILDAYHQDKEYRIKSVQPDYQDHKFVTIIGEVVT